MTAYVVATIKPWNIDAFKRRAMSLSGEWHLFSDPEDLTPDRLLALKPRYIFFPHWSWKIPAAVYNGFECVLFHMTDLPYGRGGSPLQNLILEKHRETMLSALRVEEYLDAGPLYGKCPLSLEGRAEDIFLRTADLIWDMIEEIVNSQPTPVQQTGAPTFFQRRKPEESRLPDGGNLEELYDWIRMLDAPTYPQAFVDHGDWRIEFAQPRFEGEALLAQVAIRRKEKL